MNYFGPTGKAVRVSGMCTLPVNIVNEKIYFILFVWYVFLIVVSVALIVWECFHIICSKLRLATLSRLVKRSPSGCRAVRSSSENSLKSNPSSHLRSDLCVKEQATGILSCSSWLRRTWTRHNSNHWCSISTRTARASSQSTTVITQPASSSQSQSRDCSPLRRQPEERSCEILHVIYSLRYLTNAQLNIYFLSIVLSFYNLWKLATYE